MARFGDNPYKSPLQANDAFAGTDSSTSGDMQGTVQSIADFTIENTPVANFADPGFMSAADKTKLDDLLTQAMTNAVNAKLAQQALGFFISVPVNGFVQFFSNPCTISFLLRGIRFATASGSLTLSISIDGVPVAGFTGLAVTSTPTGVTSSGDNILGPNSYIGFTISGVSSPTDFWFSLAATAILA